MSSKTCSLAYGFLSTPSGWRATTNTRICIGNKFIISIHALRVEGDKIPVRPRGLRRISIHALRVEGDDFAAVCLLKLIDISIHALRVEGDGFPAKLVHPLRYFYPRPPGGGRLMSLPARLKGGLFLSTPSGWRATFCTRTSLIRL